MVAPWIVPAAVAGGSAIGSYFSSKGKKPKEIAPAQTITQEAMLTPDQIAARNMMMQFAMTGNLGGKYQAGEAYGGALGNYNMSNLESAGQNKLLSMMNGGAGTGSDMLSLAKNELQNLYAPNSMYDPMSNGGLYSGMKRQALRENQDAANRLKAQAAFGGRLSSSSTGKNLNLLNERTAGGLQDILANLSDTYAQRRLGGISTAANLGQQEQNMNLGMIGASQQYGGLQRMLETAKAQDSYNEWLRQHTELGNATTGAMSQLAYNPVQWGVKQFTMPAVYENQTNPYEGFLNNMSSAAWSALGTQWGKAS
jgi:hypothetical protein